MKKLYVILMVNFFVCEALAQDLDNSEDFGIVKKLIEEPEIKDEVALKTGFTNRLIFDTIVEDEYQNTDRKKEFLESRVMGRLNSSFRFSNNISLNSFIRLQRMNQSSETERRNQLSTGGGDRAFEDHGLIFEELNISYDGKRYAFVAGKFNLNFGSAWKFDRGIWNHELSTSYREREKIGLDGVYRLGSSKTVGSYEFGYAIFTNDRKNFDNSLITKRDSLSKSDAKPGDARSLKSYIGSLDVRFDFADKEKLSYHFSYIDLAFNPRASSITPSKIDNQKGFAVGMSYKYPLSENIFLDSLLEHAEIKNLGGNSDVSERYFSGNLITKIHKNWNVTFGYSKHHNTEIRADGFDKNLTEVSFGYEFDKNVFFDRLIFQVGYKNQRDNYKTSLESGNSWGGLMRYYKNF